MGKKNHLMNSNQVYHYQLQATILYRLDSLFKILHQHRLSGN